MSKVKLRAIGRRVQAEHGVVSSFPDDFFGYFGWPTVAHSGDGALVVAASGLRNAHVCPFGRTVICRSEDGGRTWTSPQVVNDSPLDDRDAGLVAACGGRMVLTWFSTDNRQQMDARLQALDDEREAAHWRAGLARVTDAAVDRYGGTWMRHSDDGGLSWGPPKKLLVTTPHGPIRLQTGVLLFVGKHFPSMEGSGAVMERSLP
ncbi:MAG: sialidase family protein [Candidatus Latescibacteria bacterium]|nr:sialidase family protein [Candidatus Latescibacterota bacterium]